MGYDSISWADPTGAGPGVSSACFTTSRANKSSSTCGDSCSECGRRKEKTKVGPEAEIAHLRKELRAKERGGMTYPSQSCRDCI